MKKVLVFGSFDIIHPGHRYYLKKAKELGDKLYVIVARDKTIKKIKNRETVHDEKERLKQVKRISYVDEALLGSLGDKFKVIEKISPDIIALGYDQESFTSNLKEILKKRGLKPKIVRINAFKPEKHKSTILRETLEKT